MKFGYSMPSASPLYPEPPFHYENNQVISIIFRTAPEMLQELVPAPLRSNPDNLAFIYVGIFNVPQKGIYKEAGIGIPAFFGETFGSYLIYLYLDPALAIMPGREIWGWPKKDAEITFTWTSLHCLNYMDSLTRIAMILPDNVAIRRSLNS